MSKVEFPLSSQNQTTSVQGHFGLQEIITALLDAATNLRDLLLILLLSQMRCGITEILNISVEDIDFTRAIVTIQHLETRIKFSCPKCDASLRKNDIFCSKCGDKIIQPSIRRDEYNRQTIIPIDKETLELLREYIDQGGPVLKDGRRLIFGINRHRSWQVLKEISEQAGLPKFVNSKTGKTHNISPNILRSMANTTATRINDKKDMRHLSKLHSIHGRRDRNSKKAEDIP